MDSNIEQALKLGTLWSPEKLWNDIKGVTIKDDGSWPNPNIIEVIGDQEISSPKKIDEYFHIIKSYDKQRCIIKYNIDIKSPVYENDILVSGHFNGHCSEDQLGKLISFFGGWKPNSWAILWIANNT